MTWATSVPILVFLGLSVLELGPMYATDIRQTKALLNSSPIRVGHNNRPNNTTIIIHHCYKIFAPRKTGGVNPIFGELAIACFNVERPLCTQHLSRGISYKFCQNCAQVDAQEKQKIAYVILVGQ